MNNLINISIICLSILVLTSCRTRTTNSALRHGEILKTNLDSFDKNREKLSTKLVESLETAGEALQQENPDIPQVSKDFEKEWRSIMNRYNKLKGDFESIGQSSNDYFAELNGLSNNINNEDLRREELAKNKELERKWQSTFVEADKAIKKVTTVLESGNDFHMVLVASSIRQKLEQNVTELKNIASQAKVLLADLEEFSQAGRDLVEGRS